MKKSLWLDSILILTALLLSTVLGCLSAFQMVSLHTTAWLTLSAALFYTVARTSWTLHPLAVGLCVKTSILALAIMITLYTVEYWILNRTAVLAPLHPWPALSVFLIASAIAYAAWTFLVRIRRP